MSSNQEKLESFAAVTGCTDETKGFGLLEAAGWDLATAIELFFASEGETSAPAGQPTDDADAALARRLAEEDQEATRAPIPTKTERLYADVHDFHGHPLYVGPQRNREPRQAAPPVVDAFRDFKSEGEGTSRGQSQGPGLADLFAAPTDIMFQGSFEQAKNKAALEDKWLLVNVQSSSEFASHQLNRDTWKNDTVRDLVNGMFVFFQVLEGAQEGPRLVQAYKLFELPIILILDPITGACMFQKQGFVSPEALTDHLVPYLDHGPSHAGSASLAQITSLKRKVPEKVLTEDEELARAIAASMGAGASSAADAAVDLDMMEEEDDDDGDDDDDDMELQQQLDQMEQRQAAAQAKKSPEEARAEAEARLPPPPSESDPNATRLAIRFPDGTRAQRAFLKSDLLAALYDFCLTRVEEAAAGRGFSLVLPMPGAPAFENQAQTLQEAGLSNAMLVMKWQD